MQVQHQLRAATPNDAKALKQTVNTYPHSAYADLGQVILSLGIGEAIVTVMSERGAPTPVAWTRLRAPESLMGAADPAVMEQAVKASPLYATYAVAVDRESAREKLAARLDKAAEQEQAPPAKSSGQQHVPVPPRPKAAKRAKQEKSMIEEVVSSTAFKQVARTAAREFVRGMFGTARRGR